MPAQWWVLSFGIETTRSASSTDDRQREIAQAHEPAAKRRAPHVVLIQVDEPCAQLTEPVEQAGGRHEVLDVPAMTGPFGDDDAASAVAQKGLSRGRDDGRVGVDDAIRKELHQVRLEQDALAANLHLQQLQTPG